MSNAHNIKNQNNEKMRVLSLFSGIGAFEKGLDKNNIDYELVNYCEINEHASECYAKLHNVSEDKNLWDVLGIDENNLKPFDLLVHGSPCTNVSRNGKEEGADKGSGTDSSLMWESVRIAKAKLPKFIVWENVKNMVSKKNMHYVDDYIDELSKVGYRSTWQVLNSRYYNIPQNRERVFVVSVLDSDIGFNFPPKQELATKLKDFCHFRESDNITQSFKNFYYENINPTGDFDKHFEDSKVGRTGVKNLGMYSYDQMNRVTMIDYSDKVLSPTLSCRGVQNYVIKFYNGEGIYRPSPKMCMLLMGFSLEDYEAIKDIGNDKELWDRAGNSIVVDVAQAIFKELLSDYMPKLSGEIND